MGAVLIYADRRTDGRDEGNKLFFSQLGERV